MKKDDFTKTVETQLLKELQEFSLTSKTIKVLYKAIDDLLSNEDGTTDYASPLLLIDIYYDPESTTDGKYLAIDKDIEDFDYTFDRTNNLFLEEDEDFTFADLLRAQKAYFIEFVFHNLGLLIEREESDCEVALVS